MPFYRVIGKIHTIDGKQHVVNRWLYDAGEGGISGEALRVLSERKDKGAPWYGDRIAVIDEETHGRAYKVYVDVPYPQWY